MKFEKYDKHSRGLLPRFLVLFIAKNTSGLACTYIKNFTSRPTRVAVECL